MATRLPLPAPHLGGNRLVYWEVAIESPAVANLLCKNDADGAAIKNSGSGLNGVSPTSMSVLASVAIGVALPEHDVREPLGGRSSFALTVDLLSDGSAFAPAVLLRHPHHAASPPPTVFGRMNNSSSASAPAATQPVQGVPWDEGRKGCGVKFIGSGSSPAGAGGGAGGASHRSQGNHGSTASSTLTVGVMLDLVSGHLFYALSPRSLVCLDPEYRFQHRRHGSSPLAAAAAGSAGDGIGDAQVPPRPACCPKDHPLTWYRSQNGGTCDGCKQPNNQGEAVMFCRPCNYYLCCDCTPVRLNCCCTDSFQLIHLLLHCLI